MNVPGSDTLNSRFKRFRNILKKWSQAEKENKATFTLADFNLDALSWDKPIQSLSEYNWVHYNYYIELKSEILDNGTILIGSEPTHYTGPAPHQIDLSTPTALRE